jgi:hypothetical protein
MSSGSEPANQEITHKPTSLDDRLEPPDRMLVPKLLRGLKLIAKEGSDDSELENISEIARIIYKVQPNKNDFLARYPSVIDQGTWGRLERAAKFLAVLTHRGGLTNEFREFKRFTLTASSQILLHSLRTRGATRPRQYSYTPLEYRPLDGATQIRVLHVLSEHKEALRCRIEHVDLSSAEFIALSYEWGPPNLLFWIDVVDANGEDLGSIRLTNNLYQALCNLRDSPGVPTATQAIWIDQICINQNDKIERAQQVSLMGKIYKNARRVISYLGPEDSFDEEGFALLNHIHEQFKGLYSGKGRPADWTKIIQDFSDPDRIPEHLKFRYELTDSGLESLDSIVFGPWTRRLWMVQEVS